MSEKPYFKPTGPIDPQPRSEPFPGVAENGVRTHPLALVCAHCGTPVAPDATIDIIVRGTMLTACTPRGRAALLYSSDGVDELTVDFAILDRLVDAFNARGLVCARSAEEL